MIQIKRGTSTSLKSTVLEDGQPGYSKDTNELKIGDGKTQYSSLKAIGGSTVKNFDVSIDTSWTAKTATWAGLSATQYKHLSVPGMKSTTNIISIEFTGGSLSAASEWLWCDNSTNGYVDFYSASVPSAGYQLRLVGVDE